MVICVGIVSHKYIQNSTNLATMHAFCWSGYRAHFLFNFLNSTNAFSPLFLILFFYFFIIVFLYLRHIFIFFWFSLWWCILCSWFMNPFQVIDEEFVCMLNKLNPRFAGQWPLVWDLLSHRKLSQNFHFRKIKCFCEMIIIKAYGLWAMDPWAVLNLFCQIFLCGLFSILNSSTFVYHY